MRRRVTPYRVLAVVILAGSVLAAAIAFDAPDVPRMAAPVVGTGRGDPLAGELRRCQALGPAAQDNTACREAWRENREHFFRSRPSRPDRPVNPPPAMARPPVPLPPRDPPTVPE
jgi:conjugative transfer region protein TrbK